MQKRFSTCDLHVHLYSMTRTRWTSLRTVEAHLHLPLHEIVDCCLGTGNCTVSYARPARLWRAYSHRFAGEPSALCSHHSAEPVLSVFPCVGKPDSTEIPWEFPCVLPAIVRRNPTLGVGLERGRLREDVSSLYCPLLERRNVLSQSFSFDLS